MKLILSTFFALLMSTLALYGQQFLKGADLSFVNELQSSRCEVKYRWDADDTNGTDLYEIFKENGCNVIRARLFYGNTNDVSGLFSNMADVKKTFEEAKKNSPWVKTLLTIHYSSKWADPGVQKTPSAWSGITEIAPTEALQNQVYNYTQRAISTIQKSNIDYISIGNETNAGFVCPTNDENCDGMTDDVVRYNRMKVLLQKGIDAARDNGFAKENVMVHVAGPGNAWWWLQKMILVDNGLYDFGLLGLSYYPTLDVLDRAGHDISIDEVGRIMRNIIGKYNIRPMIVETSHPFTTNTGDLKTNRMNFASSYEFSNLNPTPQKQAQFLTDLTNVTYEAGGLGVIYWEPAWVSPASDKTGCIKDELFNTGFGSDQENQAFFTTDQNHLLVKNGGINFFKVKENWNIAWYRSVTFRLRINFEETGYTPHVGVDLNRNGQIDYGNNNNELIKMVWKSDNIWEATAVLRNNETYEYRFHYDYYESSKEALDTNCGGIDNRTVLVNSNNQVESYWFNSCWEGANRIGQKASKATMTSASSNAVIIPNPVNRTHNFFTLTSQTNTSIGEVSFQSISGQLIQAHINTISSNSISIRTFGLAKGIYILTYQVDNRTESQRLILE